MDRHDAAWFPAVIAPTFMARLETTIPDGIGPVELELLSSAPLVQELWVRKQAGVFGGCVRVLDKCSEVQDLSIPTGYSLCINLVRS